MTRHHTAFLMALAMLLMTLAACSAPKNNKLGDLDETCFADKDCRSELVCRQGFCLPVDGDDDNNSPNNSNNQNNSPNNQNNDEPCMGMCPPEQCVFNQCTDSCGDGVCDVGEGPSCPEDCNVMPELTCADVCENISVCVDQDPQECTFDCENGTEGTPDDVLQDIFECLLSLDCDDFFNGGAERCVEGIDEGGGGGDGG